MKVSAIYTYPIKSLRGVSLDSAKLTPQGIEHDRRFMLRKVKAAGEDEGGLRNMGVYHFPRMALFTTALEFDDEGGSGEVVVMFYPPAPKEDEGEDAPDRTPRQLRFPLEPDVHQLESTPVSMHGSDSTGYLMGQECDAWFSECFGYDVELVYCGANRRAVLGNLSPNATSSSSWMQRMAGSVPLVGSKLASQHEQGLGLADVAALLVVSDTSLKHVDRKLPEGVTMDLTKFRPNIVISDAPDEYEEDYWAGLDIGGKGVYLTQNCNRCVSLNVDFDTGEFAKGDLGKVWANLAKDRKVDPGAKWSPVFGRYGFVDAAAHGDTIAVGEQVTVTSVNEERTTFYWPHKVPS